MHHPLVFPSPFTSLHHAMTCLYETIPAREGDKVKQFEIKQSANDAPLTKHPETGKTIRRVILGG